MPIRFSSLCFLIAALLAGWVSPLLASPATTAASRPAADRSTPTAGYRTLMNAIDRGDAASVADSVLNEVDLNSAAAQLLARRLILGTRIADAISNRFGEKAARQAGAYGVLAVVPRFDPTTLHFEQDPQLPPSRVAGVTAQAVARPTQTRWIFMACVGNAWKLDRSHMGVDRLAVVLDDAPSRNQFLQRVLDQLKAGKFSDEKTALAALFPRPTPLPPTTNPTDRSSPANVDAAIQAAIAAGDVNAVMDCYDVSDPERAKQIRDDAQLRVTFAQLTAALIARFGPEQGKRTAEACMITSRLPQEKTDERWSIDGDEARVCSGRYYQPASMVRRGGLWRIKLSPAKIPTATGPPVDAIDQPREQMFNERQRIAADVLAHPEKYPTPASILNVLDPVRSQYAHRDYQAEAAQQHAQQAAALAQAKKEYAATQASLTPQQRAMAELTLSFSEQMLKMPSGTGFPDSMYYAQNDPDGKYIRARMARRASAGELASAADGNVSSAAEQILYWFTLIDVADDVESIGMIDWSIHGDIATGTPPNHLTFWTPTLRKVGNDWKIDVSDETNGDPAAAAARADAETKSIQAITAEVKSLKLKTLNQVIAALRTANVKGTGEKYK